MGSPSAACGKTGQSSPRTFFVGRLCIETSALARDRPCGCRLRGNAAVRKKPSSRVRFPPSPPDAHRRSRKLTLNLTLTGAQHPAFWRSPVREFRNKCSITQVRTARGSNLTTAEGARLPWVRIPPPPLIPCPFLAFHHIDDAPPARILGSNNAQGVAMGS